MTTKKFYKIPDKKKLGWGSNRRNTAFHSTKFDEIFTNRWRNPAVGVSKWPQENSTQFMIKNSWLQGQIVEIRRSIVLNLMKYWPIVDEIQLARRQNDHIWRSHGHFLTKSSWRGIKMTARKFCTIPDKKMMAWRSNRRNTALHNTSFDEILANRWRNPVGGVSKWPQENSTKFLINKNWDGGQLVEIRRSIALNLMTYWPILDEIQLAGYQNDRKKILHNSW
jgi:hypothetical protein